MGYRVIAIYLIELFATPVLVSRPSTMPARQRGLYVDFNNNITIIAFRQSVDEDSTSGYTHAAAPYVVVERWV